MEFGRKDHYAKRKEWGLVKSIYFKTDDEIIQTELTFEQYNRIWNYYINHLDEIKLTEKQFVINFINNNLHKYVIVRVIDCLGIGYSVINIPMSYKSCREILDNKRCNDSSLIIEKVSDFLQRNRIGSINLLFK